MGSSRPAEPLSSSAGTGRPPPQAPPQKHGTHASTWIAGFVTPEVDLGDLLWGEVVPFELVFANRSERPIEIVRASANCDCTVLDPPAGEPLRAGTQMSLTGYLETGRKPGNRTRAVTVELADGAVHFAKLNYRVLGTFSTNPEVLDFGVVVVDAAEAGAMELAFSFESTATPPIEVSDNVAVDSDWLESRLVDRSEKGARFLASLRVSRLDPGLNTARIRVNTNDPVMPNVVVLAKAVAVAELRPVPEAVS
ncbi:MAG TPA: DUF1573 domain-containing protein [Phycisphaerae bacterium]|nr:DUF1573 domain-containing protein [Phycisphaerae bacterium]